MKPSGIRRVVGVRVFFVLVAILCYFVTMYALANYEVLDQVEAWSTMEWVIGVIGTAILGDTFRPSGASDSAFTVTPRIDEEGSTGPEEV